MEKVIGRGILIKNISLTPIFDETIFYQSKSKYIYLL
jgi:hypothetical protein